MASNNMSPLRNFLNSIKNSVYNISIDGIGNTDINAGSLFNGFSNLYRVGPLNYTNYINNMSSLFGSCDNLTNILNFDTSNVTNMSDMFWGIGFSGTSVNIPNFNTSKVIDMSGMFSYFNFRNITLPNFNTSNVTNMHGMFFQADTYDKVPNFDTRKVTDMGAMFEMDYSINKVPNFNTSNVVSMDYMFMACSNLTSIPNLNMIKVNDAAMMFDHCQNLITVPILNISNVINAFSMFGDCPSLSQASVNNIITSCSTATKVTNKNWTNIGFNVVEGSKWNTWIRTAPDYMNAVNIGWQNIGDVIKPAYKRRIMIGDNLTGKNIYFEPYDLNEFGNYCRNTYYKRADNMMDMIYLSIDDYFRDIVYQDIHTFAKENSSYCIDIPSKISNLTNTRLYDYSNQGASISTNVFKINNNINIIVENITHRFPYDDNAPVGDETSYRAFYIEDENIRPLEVGDIIGAGTKFYFTFPDNLYEFIPNTYAPEIGKEILILQAQQTNNTENFYSIILSHNAFYDQRINIKTIDKDNVIFDTSGYRGGNIINDSFYTVTNEYIAKVTEYNNFDFWSKYILVDTRTLYRNVKIGDNLKNRTFYFTFPDDMYTEISEGMALKCEDPYFTFNSSNFTVGGSLIAYCYPHWNDNSFICYAQDRTQDWSNLTQPHPYQYEEGKGLSANWDIFYTAASKDMIVTDVYEDSIIYQNIFIREEELPLTIKEQALNLARLYYFNTTSGSGYTFSVATTRGEDVFVIQVTKNAAVQMWLTVNTTLGVVLEGSSNPTNEDYALALAEKYYKENYGNDTVYYGVATKKSETEFVIQVTQNAAVLMFLNVNVSTGEVTER